MDLVHLIEVYNEVEADIVEGFLKENGIPTVRKYKGTKGYMKILLGTPLGVDIFVSPKDYEQAKEILESIDVSDDALNYNEQDEE